MSDDGPVPARFGRPNTEVVRAVLLDMGGVVLDLGEGGGLPWASSIAGAARSSWR